MAVKNLVWLLSVFLLIACTAQEVNENQNNDMINEEIEEIEIPPIEEIQENNEEITEESAELSLWLTAQVTDVLTGEKYSVNDFKGQKVVLETFAVWCPKCTAQQKTILSLRDNEDDTIHLSWNLDPNEDESLVKNHAESNGFDWYYSVPSDAIARSLIEDFGAKIANAPSVPIIAICPDQSYQLLENGQKYQQDFDEAFEKC